jgi:hypothetical protein
MSRRIQFMFFMAAAAFPAWTLACSCPSFPLTTSEVIARLEKSESVAIRVRVLKVHRGAAQSLRDIAADVEVLETYFGARKVQSVTYLGNYLTVWR